MGKPEGYDASRNTRRTVGAEILSQFFVIKDQISLKRAQQVIAEMFNKNGYLRVTPSTKKRSLDANALSHVWYAEIAKQKGDQSAFDYKNQCKLHFGVPILRRDSEKFKAFYDRFFKQLSYPEKLAAMKYISITSTFDKTQMSEYLREIERTFAGEGIILTSLSDHD